MECNKVKAKLYLYSSGNLGRRFRNKIDRHLLICPECMKEFKAIEATIESVGKLPHEEPPSGMWDGVLLKIREYEKRGESRRWFSLSGIFEIVRLRPVPVISAFALIILLIGGVYFFDKYSSQAPESGQQSYVAEYVAFSLHDPLADKIALGRMMAVKPENGEIK